MQEKGVACRITLDEKDGAAGLVGAQRRISINMAHLGGMRDRSNLLLYEKKLYKAFAIMAMPIFLSNLLKSLHDLVDTYFIGQMANSTAAQAAI